MLLEGTIVNGQVVLDSAPPPPEGSRVTVQVSEPPAQKSKSSGTKTVSGNRGLAAEEVMKMFVPVASAPGDEACREILVGELLKKHCP